MTKPVSPLLVSLTPITFSFSLSNGSEQIPMCSCFRSLSVFLVLANEPFSNENGSKGKAAFARTSRPDAHKKSVRLRLHGFRLPVDGTHLHREKSAVLVNFHCLTSSRQRYRNWPSSRPRQTLADSLRRTKRKFLDECNLWCIMSFPGGVFTAAGAGVKTNLRFFTKGLKTERIWYYNLSHAKIGKKSPMTLAHFGLGRDGSTLDDSKLPTLLTALWRAREENQGKAFPAFARMFAHRGTGEGDSAYS